MRFAICLALASILVAPAALAEEDAQKQDLMSKSMALYGQRASLILHKKSASAFSALAAKYPDDKDMQVWCARTAYYASHRIGDMEVKAKVARRGITCAKRITAKDKTDYEGRFWWLMNRFKAEQAMGVTKALSAAPTIKGLLSRMIKDAPDRPEAYMVLGAIYRGLPGPPISFGDDDKAKELLEKAAKLAPDNAEILLELAGVYADLGDKAKARSTYQRCISRGNGPENMDWEIKDARDYAKKMLAELD